MTNKKGRELFRGEYSTGDASKDDFQLLLNLKQLYTWKCRFNA